MRRKGVGKVLDLLFPAPRRLGREQRKRRVVKQVIVVGLAWATLTTVVLTTLAGAIQSDGAKALAILIAILAVIPALFGTLSWLEDIENYRCQPRNG